LIAQDLISHRRTGNEAPAVATNGSGPGNVRAERQFQVSAFGQAGEKPVDASFTRLGPSRRMQMEAEMRAMRIMIGGALCALQQDRLERA
jgi:hypothetical protein